MSREQIAYAIRENIVTRGLKCAETYGFDLMASLRTQYDLPDSELMTLRDRIYGQALLIAEDMELEAGFFDDPAAIMMLIAIAERWVANEDRLELEERVRVIHDQHMLVDAALHLTIDHSPVVPEICQQPDQREILIGPEQPDQPEYEAFIESVINPELTRLMETQYRDNPVFDQARRMLGIRADRANEMPFRVKVLNIARPAELDPYISQIADLYAGTIDYEQCVEPQPIAAYERKNLAERCRKSLHQYDDATLRAAAPFVAACRQNLADYYRQRLHVHHDDLPWAWVEYGDDGGTIHLRASQAMAVLHFADEYLQSFGAKACEHDQLRVVRDVGAACHEYGHTQRRIGFGPFGRSAEERKAEDVSGNKGGYERTKNDITLVGNAAASRNITAPLTMLRESIREPNAREYLMARFATAFGLKALFLFMADQPQEYREGVFRRHFLDISTQLVNPDPRSDDDIDTGMTQIARDLGWVDAENLCEDEAPSDAPIFMLRDSDL